MTSTDSLVMATGPQKAAWAWKKGPVVVCFFLARVSFWRSGCSLPGRRWVIQSCSSVVPKAAQILDKFPHGEHSVPCEAN